METDILSELHAELGRGSPARLGFTRKAFQLLPELDNPRILDLGCGQGGPTLELARLSGGQVTALDIDQAAIDKLARRAGEEGLSNRVQAVRGSMSDLAFSWESFDVIWSEGSMWVLGFERALAEWQRFIRPHGFLVVHEMAWLRPDPPSEIRNCWQLVYPGIRTASEYVEQVPEFTNNTTHITLMGSPAGTPGCPIVLGFPEKPTPSRACRCPGRTPRRPWAYALRR